MAVITLSGLLTSLCVLHCLAHCEVIKQEDDDGAPFKSRCSRKCASPPETLADKDFPLYECSCSRSCTMYGDCCFDSEYKNATLRRNTDFVCLSVIGHGKYRAVSGCPPDRTSNFCADGLGHLPPVTSMVTNITYANIFCATCNGDREKLVTWSVELSCGSKSEDKVKNSSDDATRVIFRFGNFWRVDESGGSETLCMYRIHFDDSSFLEKLDLRPCTSVRKISHCSPSWTNLTILQMCRSYEDPVYFHNTPYRNSHCAMCSYLNPEFGDCIPFHVRTMLEMGLVDSDVIRFCQNRGSDACIEVLSSTQKGKPYAFADLLNINVKACVPPKGKKCCAGQRFNFKTQRCRKVVRR